MRELRRFDYVPGFENVVPLPQRQTAKSAGYDLASAVDIDIAPGQRVLVPTGVCAYMPSDEFLLVQLRSSVGIKRGLIMPNAPAIIDADYVNADNHGHIHVALWNLTEWTVSIKKGERIAQGIFTPYLTTFNDQAEGTRTGGFGSTGQ